MINKVKMIIKSLVLKLLSSIKRFPEALFFASATVIVLIALNHAGYGRHEQYQRIAMTLALGVPLALCASVAIERIRSSLVFRVASLIGIITILVLYYNFLLTEFNMVSGTRYIATTIALYGAFTCIPYLFRRSGYELYLVNLFTRLFVTYLYAAILFIGLAFTLFTINTLFVLNMTYKLYFDIWLVVVGIFAPTFFLADLPLYNGDDLDKIEYSKVLKVLLLYIVMPIIVVYTTILYAYFIKIIVERQWPVGLVSHLVLWYSIITIIVMIFVYPLKDINKWTNAFITYIPKIIMPVLFMMFISMGIRVKAYGITENRYFVLIAGIWVLGSMLYYMFKRGFRHLNVVLALVIISIVSVYGPLSSYSLSKYSQNTRLERILESYSMIHEGKITQANTEISHEDRQNINSIILYFNSNHKLRDIKSIPNSYEIKDIENVLGFQITYAWYPPYRPKEFFRYYTSADGQLVNIEKFNYYIDATAYRDTDVLIPEKDINIKYSFEEKNIIIRRNNEELYRKSVEDIARNIVKEIDPRDDYELKDNQMIYRDRKNNIEIMYHFKHIDGYRDEMSKEVFVEFVNFIIFIKVE